MKNLFFIALFISASLCLQANKVDSLQLILSTAEHDSTRAIICHQLMDHYYGLLPDSSVFFAKKAFSFSENLNNPKLHSKSYSELVVAYASNNELENAKHLLREAIQYYKDNDLINKISAAYQNMAVIAENMKLPDTTLFYLNESLEFLKLYPDSLALSDIYTTRGLAYRFKGYYQLAMEDLLQSIRILENTEEFKRMGISASILGISLYDMGRFEEGMKRNDEAIALFRKSNNLYHLSHSLGNRGNYLKELGRHEESIPYYKECLKMARITKQPGLIMETFLNIAGTYLYGFEDLDSAMIYLDSLETMAIDEQDNFKLGATYRSKAYIALEKNQKEVAKQWIKKSEPFIDNYNQASDLSETYKDMSELYNKVGNYRLAYSSFKQSTTLNDSLFTLKKDQQVEELNLIYETEKKDSEITLLGKTVELEQTKKRSLLIGLILLALAAASFIYSLIQRARKNRKIFEQEKEIEIVKREAVEKELEFKKKELTARALQLAHKNEFLQKLQDEVGQLKSSVDFSVSNASSKITRMIANDADDDNEWEQFSKEFSSLHQDFLDRLYKQFGSFSKGEVRLISLLKMNLSSKDIANILRISDEGIKKARYRLRKKLNLDSKDDLQSMLLAY